MSNNDFNPIPEVKSDGQFILLSALSAGLGYALYKGAVKINELYSLFSGLFEIVLMLSFFLAVVFLITLLYASKCEYAKKLKANTSNDIIEKN